MYHLTAPAMLRSAAATIYEWGRIRRATRRGRASDATAGPGQCVATSTVAMRARWPAA